MLYLTLHASPDVPLELEGILPEKFLEASSLDVAKALVFHGNRPVPLGEFFHVTGSAIYGEMVVRGDCSRVKRIGAGMTAGRVVVEGNVGMHAGAEMAGGELFVSGNAGDWVGAEMRGGTIRVQGNCSDHVGAAYRGSRHGLRGGKILVRGSCGDEAGLLMRRGMLVVEGNCGAFAGASMIAGTFACLGTVGPGAGAGMKRGTILLGREPGELAPGFRFSCCYEPAFLGLWVDSLRKHRVESIGRHGSRSVRCYRGDVLTGGRGELWVPV